MSHCLIAVHLLEVEPGPGQRALDVLDDALLDCLNVGRDVLTHDLPDLVVLD